MIGNRWFCEPDDGREAWCFLILEREEYGDGMLISGWEIGYGNPKKMVRKLSSTGSKEEEVLRNLLEEIHYCRSDQISIITGPDDVLPKIRTSVLYASLGGVSLKGIENISIECCLRENFVITDKLDSMESLRDSCRELGIVVGNSKGVELLWKIFLRIGPLLPGRRYFEG